MPPTIPQRGGPGALKHRPGAVSGKTILGGKRHSRLARRGGVIRISGSVYEEARLALRDYLQKVLERCVHYAEYRKAKTIGINDVIFSLRAIGRPIYGFDPQTYQGPTKKRPEIPDAP